MAEGRCSDRIDFIRDVNDYPILTRIYRIHLCSRSNFRWIFPGRDDDEKELVNFAQLY